MKSLADLLPLDFAFESTGASRVVEDGQVEDAFPALIGVYTDPQFSALIAEREALGAIAFDFAQNALNLPSAPSLAPVSLPGLCQGD